METLSDIALELEPMEGELGPNVTTKELEGGELEVEFSPNELLLVEQPMTWESNLADYIDEGVLDGIASDILEAVKADITSRAEWEQKIIKGIKELGLRIEEASEPFEGACTATVPLIIENAVKFQSKAIAELFPPGGPVKTQVLGEEDEVVLQQAERVREYMNYQLTEEMPEYFDEKERLLFHVAIVGSGFTKTFIDTAYMRPSIEFVSAFDLIVPSSVSHLRKSPRITQRLFYDSNTLKIYQLSGMYRDIKLPPAAAPVKSEAEKEIDDLQGVVPYESQFDDVYTVYEHHCFLDIPGFEHKDKFGVPTGRALPYVVTLLAETGEVLAVRRNWEEGDGLYKRKDYFVHYKFVPGFGFYGLGLVALIGNLAKSASAALRSLVDSGYFANMQGGFKARGVRLVNNDPIGPGDWKEVEATGQDLSKSIYPLPYKEPSQVLMALMEYMTVSGQKFADSTEQVIADSTNYGPVGTTMALLEASTRFFSAIHKRLHKAQREEFKLLAAINGKWLSDEYPYRLPGLAGQARRMDFDGRVDVVPVSDPNISSQAQRITLISSQLQMAQQLPGVFNMQELARRWLAAMGVQDMEKVLTQNVEPQPSDPLTDIMMATKGMPIAAFPEQDHDAHIAIKSAFVADQLNGANPLMQAAKAMLEANIREHIVLKYAQQMQGLTQVMLPQQAAQQILQANQALAELQGQGLDELAIKKEEVQVRREKIMSDKDIKAADLAVKNRELDIKQTELVADKMLDVANYQLAVNQTQNLAREANRE